MPKMPFGTAQSYFTNVEKQIAPESKEWNYQSMASGYTPPAAIEGKIAIPTWKSEMYFEYHRGVMTTQADHKRNMRRSEVQVLNAEKWASLAWLDGKNYPGNELTEDWKKVLFNQFHDLAAGSGIGVIYKDAQKDYDVVSYSTNQIRRRAMETVDERVNTAGTGTPVVVFNPLGWERSGEVEVRVPGVKAGMSASGAQVVEVKPDEKTDFANVTLHVMRVPALGYKVVWVGGAKRAGGQGGKWRGGERLRQLNHAGECEAADRGRQEERVHHQPVRQEIEFRNAGVGRVRQPDAVLQRQSEGLRRVEYRSGNARCSADDD